jgi:hypothetical protein
MHSRELYADRFNYERMETLRSELRSTERRRGEASLSCRFYVQFDSPHTISFIVFHKRGIIFVSKFDNRN